MEKRAKEIILQNIRNATTFNRNQLLNKIRNYRYQTSLPLTLKNFITFYHLPLQLIYNRGNWKRLCQEAEQIENYSTQYEKEIHRTISMKWLSCSSTSYFQFILTLAQKDFVISIDQLSDEEKAMCLMIHYDVWQGRNGFNTLEESLAAIGKNTVLVSEIIEVLEILLEKHITLIFTAT